MNPNLFLPTLRELASTYQAFVSYSSVHIRTLDITPSQFDIIATLGNTAGMPLKDLGKKTLITKGTLTGVVDRLTDKKLVQRVATPSDGRSQTVQLTAKGEALFQQIFPAHLAHLQSVFTEFSPDELASLEKSLGHLRKALIRAHNNKKESS